MGSKINLAITFLTIASYLVSPVHCFQLEKTHSGAQSFITVSSKFTLLSIDFEPKPNETPVLLEFSTNLTDLVTLHSISLCPSHQFTQTPEPAYQSQPEELSQPKCFGFSRFLPISYTLQLYISLEKLAFSQPPANEIKFSVFLHQSSKTDTPSSEITFFARLENLSPVQHFYLDRPLTVEQGKLYYEHFNEAHLRRNLSFQSRPQEDYGGLVIASHPRCGTNLFRRTLENVLGEFSSNFIGLPEKEFRKMQDFIAVSGEIRGDSNFIRFYVEHSFDWMIYSGTRVSKLILNVRNPLEVVDSRFQLIALGNSQLGKLKGEYWRSGNFKTFMTHQSTESVCGMAAQYEAIMKNDFPFLLVRFEDLITNPLEVFCDSLSYIESIPCEFSWKNKLKRYLQVNGIISYYKKTEVNLTQINSQKPNSRHVEKSDLFKIYDELTIRRIYNVFKVWVHFCGYAHLYESLMDSRKSFEDFRKLKDIWKDRNFEQKNAESIKKSLQYKLNSKMDVMSIMKTTPEELGNEIVLRKVPYFFLMEPIDYVFELREGTITRENIQFTRPEEEIQVPDLF